MGKKLTSSQLTFVDITDQRKLSAYLTSNLTTIQTLDDGVYSPSWDTTNLVITPQVFIDQTALELSNVSIFWKRKDGNAAETELIDGETVSNNILTVSANNLGSTTSGMVTYICYVSYMDTETNQTVNITDQMTYTLIKAAENAKSCFISGPQVFKYDKDGVCTSGDVITLSAAVQSVSVVKWQYYNPTTGEYEDYPSTTQNNNITSSVLNVSKDHAVFDSAGVAKIKLLTSASDIYDIITIAKIYDGQNGGNGKPGESAYTVILTNESHSFPGTVDYAVQNATAETSINAYQGTEVKNVTITAVGTKTSSLTTEQDCGTYPGLYFKVTNNGTTAPTITFTINSSMFATTSGTIPIVMTVGTMQFTKYFSWSVAYTGEGACSVSIEASSQIFKSTDGVNYTPDAITLTPHVQNLNLANTAWKYSIDGGSTWIDVENTAEAGGDVYYNTSTMVLTIPKSFTGYSASITSVVFRCENGGYTDSVTVARLSDGQSAAAAYTVMLSNEMQSIGTDYDLYPLDTNTFECVITAYEGTTQLTATTGVVSEGTFKVILPTNPTGITLGQTTAGKVTFAVTTGTAISSSGTIDLTIQIESEENEVVKTISYAASKSGSSGESAITFMLWAPEGDVFSNQSGTLPLAVQAYEGATDITELGTYQWYQYTSEGYVKIDGATSSTYNVYGTDVANIQTYKCVMHYKEKDYSDVYTMEDKSDLYISEMLTVGGTTFKNGQGGSAVYVIVRANGQEVDSFPDGCWVGTSYPASPVEGQFYWLVGSGGVTLMKYNGTTWAVAAETSDDIQELDYIWSLMDKDGNDVTFDKTGKVIYLSCAEIYSIGTLQCDVRAREAVSVNRFGNTVANDESTYSATDDGSGNVEVSSETETATTDDGEGNVTVS